MRELEDSAGLQSPGGAIVVDPVMEGIGVSGVYNGVPENVAGAVQHGDGVGVRPRDPNETTWNVA